MRVIPVLDLKQGQVVHGRAGLRAEYQPIVSRLTASASPLDVARAFRTHIGLGELYLADLDAIAGAAPALATFAELANDGFQLWVDAGLRDETGAGRLAEAGVARIVAGLETMAGPAALANLCRQFAEHVAFSLDLKDGRPLGDCSAWQAEDAATIAAQAVAAGVQHLIVLDLKRVGVGEGAGTEPLCRQLFLDHPDIELVAGGGIRGVADLRRLQECGVQAVLVASALHDGRLTRADLANLA